MNYKSPHHSKSQTLMFRTLTCILLTIILIGCSKTSKKEEINSPTIEPNTTISPSIQTTDPTTDPTISSTTDPTTSSLVSQTITPTQSPSATPPPNIQPYAIYYNNQLYILSSDFKLTDETTQSLTFLGEITHMVGPSELPSRNWETNIVCLQPTPIYSYEKEDEYYVVMEVNWVDITKELPYHKYDLHRYYMFAADKEELKEAKEKETQDFTPSAIKVSSRDKNFELTLYLDSTTYTEKDLITCYATVEYIGDEDSITVYSSDPIVSFTLKDDQYFNGESIVHTILIPITYEKGKSVQYNYIKSGGWSEDDPNAGFYRRFYSNPELLLPAGNYEISATIACSSDINNIPESEFQKNVTVSITVTP